MSLGVQKVSASSAPGMAAAATAHLFSGGRGVAAAAQSPVESAYYSTQAGVNDNSIVHYDDEGNLDPDGQRRESAQQDTQTDFMARRALSFAALIMDPAQGEGSSTNLFSDMLARGIRGYERVQGLVNSGMARTGSTINQLS